MIAQILLNRLCENIVFAEFACSQQTIHAVGNRSRAACTLISEFVVTLRIISGREFCRVRREFRCVRREFHRVRRKLRRVRREFHPIGNISRTDRCGLRKIGRVHRLLGNHSINAVLIREHRNRNIAILLASCIQQLPLRVLTVCGIISNTVVVFRHVEPSLLFRRRRNLLLTQ